MAFRTPQKYPIHTEFRGARGVITNLNAISRALDATRLAATKTFQIDRQVRSLTVQMGRASGEATRLAEASLGLANATGASVDSTTKLMTAQLRTGRTLRNLHGAVEEGTSTFNAMAEAGDRNIKMQSELVDLFGLSAASVVETGVKIRQLGGDMGRMTGAVAKFQTKFGIPGMFKEMIKVTDFADKMLSRFTKSTVGDSQEIINTTLKVGAVYAKAYGIDVAKGIDLAMQQQKRFTEQIHRDRKVFLGLEKTFDGLTMALIEGVGNYQEVQRLARLGREDPIKYAEEVLRVTRQLGGKDSFMGGRFLQNVIDNSDEATAKLLANERALADALRTRADLGKAGLEQFAIQKGDLKEFETVATTYRRIGAVVLETISHISNLAKTIIGTAFADILSEAFQGALLPLRKFNEVISRLAKEVRTSEFFQKAKPILLGIGKVLIGVGAAAGVVASSIASTIIPFKVFVEVVRAVPVLGKAGTMTIGNLASAIWQFGKETVRSAGILAGFGIAFNEFGKTLRDPTLGKTELFIRGFRAMAVGVVEVFDSLLGGIPTWIAKQFFPDMRGTLSDEVRNLFQRLEAWLAGGAGKTAGAWWDNLKAALTKKVEQFKVYLDSEFENFNNTAAAWGQNIGRAIGTLAFWAWESAKKLLDPTIWAEGWETVVGYFKGDGAKEMKGAWEKTIVDLLKLAKTFTINLVDEVLRPWGKGWLEVESGFLDFYDSLRDGFSWVTKIGLPKLEEGWLQFKVGIIKLFFDVKDMAMYAFDSAGAHIKKLVSSIAESLYSVKSIYYTAKKMAAESAILAIQATLGPAYWAAKAAGFTSVTDPIERSTGIEYLQGVSLSAVTGAAEATTNERFYKGERETAEKELLKLADEDIKRRKKSKSDYERITEADRERLSKLTSPDAVKKAKEAETSHLEEVAERARLRKARHKKRDEDIEFREGLRQLEAWDIEDAAKAANKIRPKYLGRVDQILVALKEESKNATTGLEKNLAERVYKSVELSRHAIAEFSSPGPIVTGWQSVLGLVNEHYPDLVGGTTKVGAPAATGAGAPMPAKAEAPSPKAAAGTTGTAVGAAETAGAVAGIGTFGGIAEQIGAAVAAAGRQVLDINIRLDGDGVAENARASVKYVLP
jgi:hypothetical protein